MVKVIKVLGAECCSSCNNLKKKIEEKVQKKGLDIEIEKINDFSEIATYGVMSTPAVVIDEEVKSYGSIPKDKEIDEWLE